MTNSISRELVEIHHETSVSGQASVTIHFKSRRLNRPGETKVVIECDEQDNGDIKVKVEAPNTIYGTAGAISQWLPAPPPRAIDPHAPGEYHHGENAYHLSTHGYKRPFARPKLLPPKKRQRRQRVGEISTTTPFVPTWEEAPDPYDYLSDGADGSLPASHENIKSVHAWATASTSSGALRTSPPPEAPGRLQIKIRVDRLLHAIGKKWKERFQFPPEAIAAFGALIDVDTTMPELMNPGPDDVISMMLFLCQSSHREWTAEEVATVESVMEDL